MKKHNIISIISNISLVTALLFNGNLLWSDRAQDIVSGAGILYHKAYQDYAEENYVSAIHYLNKIKQASDRELQGKMLFLLGKSYANQKKPDNALKYFDKAAKQEVPIKDAILYERAKIYSAKKNYIAARKAYTGIIEKFPQSPFIPKALFDLGELHFKNNQFANAEKEYTTLLQKYPNFIKNDTVFFNLAVICEKNQNYRKAYEHYQKIFYNYPDSEYSDKIPGKLYHLSNYLQNSRPLPKPEDLLNAAKLLHQKSRFKESNDMLDRLLSYYPKSPLAPEAMYRIGFNKYSYYAYDSSLIAFQELIVRYPADKHIDEAYFYRAKIFQIQKNTSAAVQAYKKIIDSFPHGDITDKAIYNLAAIYLEKKYKVLAYNYYEKLYERYPESPLADDAIWEQGWFYYITEQYNRAYNVLKVAATLPQADDFTAKCVFWAAKAAQKDGNEEEAFRLYSKLFDKFAHTYYAFRVWDKFSTNQEHRQTLLALPGNSLNLTTSENYSMESNLRLNMLREFGYESEFFAEVSHYKETNALSELFSKTLISKYKYFQGDYYNCVKGIENIVYEEFQKYNQVPKDAIKFAYPKVYWNLINKYAQEYSTDPYLVIALIREESRFKKDAKSCTNAQGLMQIMPGTAKDIAKRLLKKNASTYDLTSAETNISMGTYYFTKLLSRFNNNVILALAGYNGGPTNALKWWDGKKNDDIDEFIETIPFSETRNYVQKVLKSYWMYKKIYSDDEQAFILSMTDNH
ncbi:MAG: hypothetical protein A2X42_02855 [Candidatus Margulisbacteria bacterium GWF2_38_17]|nr:MAG: hypothetical protein A2X42_02855 [Candidatus Margulisbacteria bacterium GWF2_38_17]HCY37528.1 hypothetical protein [Candidatus Margulisiibacteriota bacterium]